MILLSVTNKVCPVWAVKILYNVEVMEVVGVEGWAAMELEYRL